MRTTRPLPNAMRTVAIAIICAAAAGIVSAACPTSAGAQQLSTDLEPRLDPQIGELDRVQYRSVRDSREWRNPWLSVSNTGFLLRSASIDWPYGRVAVVQSPSIVPADAEFMDAMKRNAELAKEVLAKLGADWWSWPA